MSQYDFGNLESPLTGTALINTHLEPWRNALHSLHSGSSRPSYASAGMAWLDTTANPWLLKIFDGSDDIILGRIDTTANTFTATGNVRAAGSGGIAFYDSSGTLIATMGAGGGTGVTWKGQQNFQGTIQAEGKVALKDDGELTISSGAVTITGANHTIDTESDAASDDLDTINGAVDGAVLVLRAANAARTVVVKHNTGNIVTPDGSDITLDETSKVVTLVYDAELSDWLVVSAPDPEKTVTETASYLIAAPDDQDYKLIVKIPFAGTITETTTISTSGTCTATFKINSTALGGTSNSVSTTEQSRSHASSNTFSADDDIVVTISSNSSCEFLSLTIKFTRDI